MEKIQDTETVYQGARFSVKKGVLRASNGQTIKRDYVVHPGAAVILPLKDDDHIVMIRNERYAVGKELWELPAGTLEPQEPPIETAKRELIEETGYRAGLIEPLCAFYTTPGFCNEKIHAFVARELTHVGQALDESEKITVEVVSWTKALHMVHHGIIEDAKTLLCLLFYRQFH